MTISLCAGPLDAERSRLAEYAEHIARLELSALILDSELRLVWVSDYLKQFVGSADETDLGAR